MKKYSVAQGIKKKYYNIINNDDNNLINDIGLSKRGLFR